MIRLFLFTFIVFLGLSMAIAKSDVQFRDIHQKRFSRNTERAHSLRNLMGKLIDSETNNIYTMEGQKQYDIPLNSEAAAAATTTAPPLALNVVPKREEIACLAACHSCVADYSLESFKKKAADNCGPMCDCADSCFLMSIEEVGQIYGQTSNIRNDKDCWWRIYTEMFNDGLPSSI